MATLPAVPTVRLPSPGPSFVRDERVRLRSAPGEPDRWAVLGMSSPSVMDDGWWLATLWAADDDGVVEATSVAPLSGPPPEPPIQTLGPVLAGALAGLLAQADGRQLIRLRMPPAPDESRPWARPLILWVAVTWDAVRTATMSSNELARELMRAFGRAVTAAGSPA